MIMIAGGSREDYRAQVLLGKVVVGSIFGKAKVISMRLCELSGRIQQPLTNATRPGE